eukprot:CAMPEP_0174270296 /NCGR_PEP_ID=MMETSP0439-20130205/43939_1 /TAXON_ID=0 /ORGANISM="Stereomyxa ramosa, Strain Chinc5" /LENGTH=100 /DNA_ID=CAMNT_0015359535 /DNA_START=31 /DNA_END=330 /DNA_ORIENTATION=+
MAIEKSIKSNPIAPNTPGRLAGSVTVVPQNSCSKFMLAIDSLLAYTLIAPSSPEPDPSPPSPPVPPPGGSVIITPGPGLGLVGLGIVGGSVPGVVSFTIT